MKHCCKNMDFFVNQSMCADSDELVTYMAQFDEYGIAIHDMGSSYVQITYCPWCGNKLPESKRDRWFEELEKIGIENPIEEEYPLKYHTDQWWKEISDKIKE